MIISRHRWAVAGTIVLFLAVMAPLLAFELVWDDVDIHLVENPYLGSWQGLAFLCSEPYRGLFIPLTYSLWSLLFWVCHELIWSLAVVAHGLSIGLHAVNGLLVYSLLRKLNFTVSQSWCGLMVFWFHPIQVESVAWASECRGLLAGFWCLAALRLEASQRSSFYSYIFLILAMLSKPSAASLPVMIFVFRLTMQMKREHTPHNFIRIAGRAAWLMLCVLPFVAITDSSQGQPEPIGLASRLAVAADTLFFQLVHMIQPFGLGPAYGRMPQVALSEFWWIAGAGLLVLIVWAFYTVKQVAFRLAVGWLLAGLLPNLGIVPFVFQTWSTVADRYAYLSMLGASLIAALYIGPRLRYLVLILCVLGFVDQSRIWQNNVTLWAHCAQQFPDPRCYNNLGTALMDRNMDREAEPWFAAAAEADPIQPLYTMNLALSQMHQGRLDEAVEGFDTALWLEPDYALAYENRAIALAKMGRFKLALQDLNQAILLKPRERAFALRARVWDSLGRPDLALMDRQQAGRGNTCR